jgi:hypothetical protein
MTITAAVTDEGAAKFHYRFAGHSLAEIMDTNIRGAFIARMCPVFGTMTLDDEYVYAESIDADGKKTRTKGDFVAPGVRVGKGKVIADAAKEVKEEYKAYGIDIYNAASSQGIVYENKLIQDAIDKVYTASKDQEAADAERVAINTRADAYSDNARKRADADKYVNDQAQKSLSALRLRELWIHKWDGNLPKFLGPGTPLLNISE